MKSVSFECLLVVSTVLFVCFSNFSEFPLIFKKFILKDTHVYRENNQPVHISHKSILLSTLNFFVGLKSFKIYLLQLANRMFGYSMQ